MRKVEMTKEQAAEMFYNVNSYYVFLKAAENVDKVFFGQLKFWNATMNKDLIGARYRVSRLLDEFNKEFKAVDTDVIDYEYPGELYEALQLLSRLNVEEIKNFLNILQEYKK